MGTITLDWLACVCYTRDSKYNDRSSAMSGQHTYRVKARCMVDLYQYITADDVNVAVELALDAYKDWEVETLDDAEVRRVLQIERID